jgi:hypothetical protein
VQLNPTHNLLVERTEDITSVMFANNSDNNDDIESMPQLKFKVPNFIGTLTERKRPVFAEGTS